MTDRQAPRRIVSRLGWWLMGWPVGIRNVNPVLMRFGPYRWGAWLVNRGR